jgi:hypothetical protein
MCGIARVAVGTGHTQAIPIRGRLQWVDRERRVTGGDQRLHPRTPIGLDPDRDLPAGVAGVFPKLRTDHRAQPCDPATPSGSLALAGVRPGESINSMS